jgi:isoleucyl-tRNA synthetase
MAPVSPFYVDQLYLDLSNVTSREKAESVHLADFPMSQNALIDKQLEAQMQTAQDISSMVLSLRRKVNIKVRQPLQSIMIPAVDAIQKETIESVKDLILNEVNVKSLNFVEKASDILIKKVKPDFKKLGPRYGKDMKQLTVFFQSMTMQEIAQFEASGSFTFDIEGQERVIELSDVEIISEDIPGWLVANEGRMTIALDITVTDELKKEGLARELVNRIQNLRKSSGFEITDKICLTISSSKEMNESIQEHKKYISNQVLANSIDIINQLNEGTVLDFDDFNLTVQIEKV